MEGAMTGKGGGTKVRATQARNMKIRGTKVRATQARNMKIAGRRGLDDDA
jgi:hypothetical protein